MKPFKGFPHVLEAQQFDPDTLESLFIVANAIRSAPERYQGVLAGRKVALLFSQPSSRTRGSFQIAAEMLGANVHVEEHMAAFSSVVKGESLEDTVRTFLQYGMHYFIIRWTTEGSVARAAGTSSRWRTGSGYAWRSSSGSRTSGSTSSPRRERECYPHPTMGQMHRRHSSGGTTHAIPRNGHTHGRTSRS